MYPLGRNLDGYIRIRHLRQAAVLAAVLADAQPGSLSEAFAHLPPRMRNVVRKSLDAVLALLAQHPGALDELGAMRKP